MVAYFYGRATQWALFRILEQEFQNTELAEAVAALERDRFDELAEANAARYVIVQEFLHLPFQLLLKLNILCRFLFIHSLVNLHMVILARPEYEISQSLGFLYLTLPSLQLLTALQV